jgi:hypothetical protein
VQRLADTCRKITRFTAGGGESGKVIVRGEFADGSTVVITTVGFTDGPEVPFEGFVEGSTEVMTGILDSSNSGYKFVVFRRFLFVLKPLETTTDLLQVDCIILIIVYNRVSKCF